MLCQQCQHEVGNNLLTIGAGQNPDRNAKPPVPRRPAHHFPEDTPGRSTPGPCEVESGCPPALTILRRLRGQSPRVVVCSPTHLRAPMFLLFPVPRRLEPDLRCRQRPRPHNCPAHSLPEMLLPGLFFPTSQPHNMASLPPAPVARVRAWSLGLANAPGASRRRERAL